MLRNRNGSEDGGGLVVFMSHKISFDNLPVAEYATVLKSF